MKFGVLKTAGYVPTSVRTRHSLVLFTLLGCVAFSVASAQALYKYRGDDGEWIYSDRPPDDGKVVAEVRSLTPTSPRSGVSIDYEADGDTVRLVATNEYFAPVELALRFETISGLEYPHPDDPLRWLLPPRSAMPLVRLARLDGAAAADRDLADRDRPLVVVDVTAAAALEEAEERRGRRRALESHCA